MQSGIVIMDVTGNYRIAAIVSFVHAFRENLPKLANLEINSIAAFKIRTVVWLLSNDRKSRADKVRKVDKQRVWCELLRKCQCLKVLNEADVNCDRQATKTPQLRHNAKRRGSGRRGIE
jgi:hypothetical protein